MWCIEQHNKDFALWFCSLFCLNIWFSYCISAKLSDYRLISANTKVQQASEDEEPSWPNQSKASTLRWLLPQAVQGEQINHCPQLKPAEKIQQREKERDRRWYESLNSLLVRMRVWLSSALDHLGWSKTMVVCQKKLLVMYSKKCLQI